MQKNDGTNYALAEGGGEQTNKRGTERARLRASEREERNGPLYFLFFTCEAVKKKADKSPAHSRVVST